MSHAELVFLVLFQLTSFSFAIEFNILRMPKFSAEPITKRFSCLFLLLIT